MKGLTQGVGPFGFIRGVWNWKIFFNLISRSVLNREHFHSGFIRTISCHKKSLIWFVIVFLCLLSDWLIMKRELFVEYSSALGTVLKAVGDVMLILSPYWLLPPKWKWSAVLFVWLVPILCICNLAYFRFWSDLIPPAAITMGENVDGNLIRYGLALLKWNDLLFIIPPVVSSFMLIYLKPYKSPPISPKLKGLLFGISFLLGVVGQISYFKTVVSQLHSRSRSTSFVEALNYHFMGVYSDQHKLYCTNGPLYYGLRFIIDSLGLLRESLSLSDDQKQEISDFLNLYRLGKENSDLSGNKGRDICLSDTMNIVYIIMESLNSDMVSKKIGDWKVMPTLDSLANSERSVVFDNVVSQIKASSSSDGHLLLMTGLLPPEKVSYSVTCGSKNTFISLADALPNHNKYLLLADTGVCWNEGNTLRNFGLGDPQVINDRPEYPIDVYGQDGAMFLKAISMMKEVRCPFFMTLMTISMHLPFNETAWPLPDILKSAEGMTQSEKNYANVCNNTDRYIGYFLNSLPENTIVIIASDHHQNVTSDGKDAKAFYMAVNTGRTERISRTVGQVNLFPATLEILGAEMSYRGIAPSAFNPCVDGTIDSYGNVYGNPTKETFDSLIEAYKISDLIIRSDYFKEVGK